MKLIRRVTCVILLVAAPLAAVARQNNPDKKPSLDQGAKPTIAAQKTLEPSERKILSVLKRILELQPSLADENARTGIQTVIGDMLWNYDEPRARAVLEGAFYTIANMKFTDRDYQMATVGPRFLVLRTIARRDSALALKLQQAIDLPSSPGLNSKLMGNTPYSERIRLQNDLATFIFISAPPQKPGSDVQRLAQALRPLADRLELNRLMPFLKQIRSKDAKAADEVFVRALESAELAAPGFDELKALAWYLFPAFGEGVISFSSSPVAQDPYEAIQIDPAVIHRFFDLTDTVVSRRLMEPFDGTEGTPLGPRSYPDDAIQRLLLPYYDRFMPDGAAAFRSRVEELRHRNSAEAQAGLALNEPGTVEELLARAERTTDQRRRDRVYERAAGQATAARRYDQAAAIIEKIKDEAVRSRKREDLLRERTSINMFDEIRTAIRDGDFDRAEKIVSEISDRSARMGMFQSMIGIAFQKDRERSAQMLADAHRVSSNVENAVERCLQLIGLAHVAGSLDVTRGFEEMKGAIDEFNRAGFVPEWDKYEEIVATSSGEGRKTRVNVGLSALVDNPDFQWLGLSDFDRGLALAQQLQGREASAFAQLAVCRGALSRLQASTPKMMIAPEKPQEPDKAKQR